MYLPSSIAHTTGSHSVDLLSLAAQSPKESIDPLRIAALPAFVAAPVHENRVEAPHVSSCLQHIIIIDLLSLYYARFCRNQDASSLNFRKGELTMQTVEVLARSSEKAGVQREV
jgi:hypothetical protein